MAITKPIHVEAYKHFAVAARLFPTLLRGDDAVIWQKIRDYDPTSSTTEYYLNGASSDSARDLMKAAFDAVIWQKIRDYDPTSSTTEYYLNGASSDSARVFMSSLLNSGAEKDDPMSSGQRRNDYRRHDSGNAKPRVGPQPTATPLNSKSRAQVAYDELITNADPKLAEALRSHDQADVRRVIASAIALREKVAAEGGSITDRQIYLRYIRAATKPEPSREATVGAQIMNLVTTGQNRSSAKGSVTLPF